MKKIELEIQNKTEMETCSTTCSTTQQQKSQLERVVQHLYPLEFHCDKKNTPVFVEERSYKTDTTSYSRRTAAATADITIEDQVTDENNTLQLEKHLISSGHQMGGECQEFTRTNLLEFTRPQDNAEYV